MADKTAPVATEHHLCECAMWEVGVELDPEVDTEFDIVNIGCEELTTKTFAQGHDSKLKALLIRAGINGWDVRRGRPTGVLTHMDYQAAAAMFRFGAQVLDAVDRANAKAKEETREEKVSGGTGWVRQVRDYATAHAGSSIGGWVRVAQMSDEQIAAVLGRVRTADRAIQRMRSHLGKA